MRKEKSSQAVFADLVLLQKGNDLSVVGGSDDVLSHLPEAATGLGRRSGGVLAMSLPGLGLTGQLEGSVGGRGDVPWFLNISNRHRAVLGVDLEGVDAPVGVVVGVGVVLDVGSAGPRALRVGAEDAGLAGPVAAEGGVENDVLGGEVGIDIAVGPTLKQGRWVAPAGWVGV